MKFVLIALVSFTLFGCGEALDEPEESVTVHQSLDCIDRWTNCTQNCDDYWMGPDSDDNASWRVYRDCIWSCQEDLSYCEY